MMPDASRTGQVLPTVSASHFVATQWSAVTLKPGGLGLDLRKWLLMLRSPELVWSPVLQGEQ